jgi:putative transferase (TIGR04331 family)
MFLVTTADQTFWNKNEKTLFLGEWCKLYDQKNTWSNIEHEVLPYHWNDRERVYKDYQYLNELYERLLPDLVKQLNETHHTDHSLQYWRIVIGPWFEFFIQVLYDRYLSIHLASQSGKVTTTWVPDFEKHQFVPNDFTEFGENACNDSYNQILYAQLIKAMGVFTCESKNLPLKQGLKIYQPSCINPVKKAARSILRLYGKLIPDNWNRVIMVATYLPPLDLLRLQTMLGQLPYPISPAIPTRNCKINIEMREKIFLPAGENQFESLLRRFTSSHMPKVYLEGYSEMHKNSISAFPRFPQTIFTANGLMQNEGFKFWAANQTERGTKIIATQHGGHYGTGLWSTIESHEIKASSQYITWGWKSEENPTVMPGVSGQLSCMANKIKSTPQGAILWITMALPRYSYSMYSVPSGPQMFDYISDQEGFWSATSPEVRELLLLRLPLYDRGFNEKRRWHDFAPTLKTCTGKLTMVQQLNKSRLCIVTYNATSFLETLAANFPIIVFWNPDHSDLRKSAKPYFEKLIQAGILYSDPKSAAEKVNEIYQNPLSWWLSPSIQAAREEFCHQFAKTSKSWRTTWKMLLLNSTKK